MTPAVRIRNLGKQYTLGARERGYTTFREALSRAVSSPWRRFRNLAGRSADAETFWALKDVSFDIEEGEVVGIIGRNGAGKSTLLKILSQITEPTEGEVELHGRVGSLLEVGTGFHPELTGRENIYLNGAILGMKRHEIQRRFDEIVAFSEIEQFLDTPVKRYSSGMYMRLAFAVAAHLDPEILLVDEVLAVGDVAFQNKCMGKMTDVAREGRTVLFVSHNIPAILYLCSRVILLKEGQVGFSGASAEAVEHYLDEVHSVASVPFCDRLDRYGNQRLRFQGFRLVDSTGKQVAHAKAGEDIRIALQYSSVNSKSLKDVHIALGFHGRHKEYLFHLSTSVSGGDIAEIPSEGEIICTLTRLPLQPGRYTFNLFSTVAGQIADWIQEAGSLDVAEGDFFLSGRLPPADRGPFLVDHSWGVALRTYEN